MGGITGVDTTRELRRLGCTAAIVGLTGIYYILLSLYILLIF